MQDKAGKSRERTITFVLKKSENYTAAHADGGSVVMKADEVGAMMQINFTRADGSPTTEKMRVVDEGPSVRVVSQPEFDSPLIKYVECSVIMRPDQALAIAAAIVQNIQQLPPQLRALYRIPDAAIVDQAPVL